jgi:hypothetical protein
MTQEQCGSNENRLRSYGRGRRARGRDKLEILGCFTCVGYESNAIRLYLWLSSLLPFYLRVQVFVVLLQ